MELILFTFMNVILIWTHSINANKIPSLLSYGPPFLTDTTGFEIRSNDTSSSPFSKGFASTIGSTDLIKGMKLSASTASYIYGDFSLWNGSYVGGLLRFDLQTGKFFANTGKGVIGTLSDVLVLSNNQQIAFIGSFESLTQSPGVSIEAVAICSLDGTNCFQIGNGFQNFEKPLGYNVPAKLLQQDNYLYAMYHDRLGYCYVKRIDISDLSGDWEVVGQVYDICTFEMGIMMNKLHLIGPRFGDLTYSNPLGITPVGILQWDGSGWTAVGVNPGSTDMLSIQVTFGTDFAFYSHYETGYDYVVTYWNATGSYWLPLYYWLCYPYPMYPNFKVAAINSTSGVVYCWGQFYQMNVNGTTPTVSPLGNFTAYDNYPSFEVIGNDLYILNAESSNTSIIQKYDLQLGTIVFQSDLLANLASMVVYIDTICSYGDRLFIFDSQYNSVGGQFGFSNAGAVWDDSFGMWTAIHLSDPPVDTQCRCYSDGDNLTAICLDLNYRLTVISDLNSDPHDDTDLIQGNPVEISKLNLTYEAVYPSNVVKIGEDFYFGAFRGFWVNGAEFPYSYIYKWNSGEKTLSEFLGPLNTSAVLTLYPYNDTLYIGISGNLTMDNIEYYGIMKFNLISNEWEPIEGAKSDIAYSYIAVGVNGIAVVDQFVYLCGNIDHTTSGHAVQNFYMVDSQGNFAGDLNGGYQGTALDGLCLDLVQIDDVLYFGFGDTFCVNEFTCQPLNAYNITSGYYSSVRPATGGFTISQQAKSGKGAGKDSNQTVVIAVSVAVAALAVVAATLGLALYLVKKRQRKDSQFEEAELQTRASDLNSPNIVDSLIDFQSEEVLLKDVLGKGAFGTVWGCVLPNRNNASYAVKQILVSKADTVAVKRLEKEIHDLLKLRHAHVVHSVGYKKNVSPTIVEFFLFMELFEKPFSLRGVINKKAKRFEKSTNPNKKMEWFTVSEVQLFMKQISDGLNYLHSKGIAHRDLKTANILVRTRTPTSVRSVHITDFGLSTFITEQEETSNMGTLGFLAPEVSPATSYDPFKADIWAFGMLVFELLTFQEPTHQGVVPDFPLEREITSTSTKFAAFESILKLFHMCTEKDPKERPSSSELFDMCCTL